MRCIRTLLTLALVVSFALCGASVAVPQDAPAGVTLNVTCLTPVPAPGEDFVFDVRIENHSGKGMEIPLCEGLKLCCVQTAHPSIECKRCGGVSLLDACKEGTTPVVRKTYLPDGAYLGVKARVPAGKLSQNCMADPNNVIQVSWVLQCPEGDVVRSNKIQIAGKQ